MVLNKRFFLLIVLSLILSVTFGCKACDGTIEHYKNEALIYNGEKYYFIDISYYNFYPDLFYNKLVKVGTTKWLHMGLLDVFASDLDTEINILQTEKGVPTYHFVKESFEIPDVFTVPVSKICVYKMGQWNKMTPIADSVTEGDLSLMDIIIDQEIMTIDDGLEYTPYFCIMDMPDYPFIKLEFQIFKNGEQLCLKVKGLNITSKEPNLRYKITQRYFPLTEDYSNFVKQFI